MGVNNVKDSAGFDLVGWLSEMDNPTKEVAVYVDGRHLGRIHKLADEVEGLKGQRRAEVQAELDRLRAERAASRSVFVVAALSGEESGAIVATTPVLPDEDNDWGATQRRTTRMVAAAVRSITRADGKQIIGPIDDELMSTMRRVMGGSEWSKIVSAMNAADDADDAVDPTNSPEPSGETRPS